ncbi:MAG: group II intron reverse transcriptase/maturase [Candidatus Raymondbacteria bacterium RifOxyA12_full_50_37]|uniref:Group II intron reverse transcriptase/maturase n=1 Tax=Candidatus Raymondbacteria bacterium RIFOXYD12_FULL_49_13 TaxID=1817890 RepID=A0A1F7FK94_UNCRA|nr:MAG: group II intron reverse transcriptase/maturase [Candidatus Raymondbacteria bacterium RifOxyA12_full_50_37]OGJ94523.1 MAG: group II intron reverse transcriptase/maturase [Candidatus Raymondbacteria bacterium RIFOXYA2_FULL_49_16]OGJ98527.1 MAG: group II intron reverse transcriptase/maturase [Candidatus Raymondbacteria bacterium RifOxyC12_full_50_8]OGK02858.1 MAG: group II intron reverse transcriptase/maturase [Candidatus Raymondbacteria bacterium RifOxyB12_full_50_8]OGK07001.1 MAG: group 
MTASTDAGALIGRAESWRSIDWPTAQRETRRLQVRIAKAVKEGRHGRVQSLQWLLTHSRYAKALAVKRVTSNKGKRTPGVDGVLWKTGSDRMQAIRGLRQRGYQARPLRRTHIPKKSGKLRPLSIPTMYDRAMQALYKLALAPVAETTADRNSYGFREGRCCADAVAAAFSALSKPNSATWVWEADITGCYDNISHAWMMENIPMEKRILRQWLKAGYVEHGITYPTLKGTPQGGVISPLLANMTLDGLEQTVLTAVPKRLRVNFLRYADDFIVTAKSKALLILKIIPAVKAFLAKRGLTISEEKSKITYIRDGFKFLGQSFRKSGNVLRITPSIEAVRAVIEKAGTIIRKYRNDLMEKLIGKLNETLRGWANYHRHVVSSKAFNRVDQYVYRQLWRMIRRNHPGKSRGWLIQHYWQAAGQKWIFSVRRKRKDRVQLYGVVRVSSIGIRRHLKVKADANPYNPVYARYFAYRREKKEARLWKELSAWAIVKYNRRTAPQGRS